MKVVINKNSWHYRWFQFITEKCRDVHYNWKDPESICLYFWGFIYNNLYALFNCVVITAGGLFLIFLTLSPLIGYYRYYYFGETKLLLVAACFYGIITALGAVVLVMWQNDLRDERVRRGVSVGPFVGAIYAFKNKICPMIEYKEKE